jgi:8-oxo-dGTP pyrophosphatase MutT (NUDIX family)
MPTQSAIAVLTYCGKVVVLTRRAKTRRHFPGIICCPGGKLDPGETPRQAIQRELVEELGLGPSVYQLDPEPLQLEMLDSDGKISDLVYVFSGVLIPINGDFKPYSSWGRWFNTEEIDEVLIYPLNEGICRDECVGELTRAALRLSYLNLCNRECVSSLKQAKSYIGGVISDMERELSRAFSSESYAEKCLEDAEKDFEDALKTCKGIVVARS